jgi:deoxyguanosine kinase
MRIGEPRDAGRRSWYHAGNTRPCRRGRTTAILRRILEFRHLAIDGPPGVGKSTLADRLGTRLDAAVVLDETDNPFLADALAGRAGAALQAQLFSLLARHRQQEALRQSDLFSQTTVCDYLFDRDKIYAYLVLDDNELFIYQRLYDLLVRDVAPPDLVIYLQAPTEGVWSRLRQRARHDPEVPLPDERFVRELNDALNHFFFHYTATPLLVVETSHLDLTWDDAAVDDLLRQIAGLTGGTRYFVPRTT